jgi:hypothetical protein
MRLFSALYVAYLCLIVVVFSSCNIIAIMPFLAVNGEFNVTLRVLTRKTKMSLIPSEEDICKLLFTRRKQQRTCRLFLDWIKERGACTRSELSKFAWNLEAGKLEKGFKYRRTSFYRQIRKPLLTLGLITIEQRFGEKQDFDVKSFVVQEKYVLVRQPIPKRPPDGLNLPRLMWIICKRWNDEFSER